MTRTDSYKFAYVNSIARLGRAKGDVSGSLERLTDAGYVRKVAFPALIRTRGRRPREVFVSASKLKEHFDFGSSESRGTSATHMLLLLSSVNFLAECGAYVDVCRERVLREEAAHGETEKRAPDAWSVFRRDEFSWETTRPFSIEGETPTSLYNNKWTRQVSINARKNFLQGFRANIFACFGFDVDKVRSIIGELPAELAQRTYCLAVDCDTDSVSWAIQLPLKRKMVDTEALGWS
jgi:hypothetical protein